MPSNPVVVAVGDIACPAGSSVTSGSCQQSATELIANKQNPNAVFVLGDNQYEDGTYGEYTGLGAYGDTWGVFNPIVDPVPGNHEYSTAGAAGYFQYFGARANPENTPGGYYSFNLGNWHVVALNSNCTDSDPACKDAVAGGTTSAQTSWLQSDLAANRSACVLAMWHHPAFSAGSIGNNPNVGPLWDALYAAHADVVLNGHDHVYERYTQLNPAGAADPTGIREFVVGTGGESLFSVSNPPATLQKYDYKDFGVLKLTLHSSSYDWEFITTSGTVFDSGTTPCHGPGSGPASAVAAREIRAPGVPGPSGPQLSFDARPLSPPRTAVVRRGLPVAIHCSRGCDVTVTAWLRNGRRLRRIASFYETESQITKPYSQILLRLPARSLQG
ncbi:MAG: metallophosphoesterase family protein, partial [Solirubrobacteraceae bacterium]